MRPERFHYEMNIAFEEWYKTKSVNKFLKLLREMERVWPKWAIRDGDSRSGEETYGYKDQERIKYDMFYISDRWNCAFRLKWLIDGIKNGKIC